MRVLKNLTGSLELMGLLLLITRILLLNWNLEKVSKLHKWNYFFSEIICVLQWLRRSVLSSPDSSSPSFHNSGGSALNCRIQPQHQGCSILRQELDYGPLPHQSAVQKLNAALPCMSPLPELSKRSLPNQEGGSECHPYSVWHKRQLSHSWEQIVEVASSPSLHLCGRRCEATLKYLLSYHGHWIVGFLKKPSQYDGKVFCFFFLFSPFFSFLPFPWGRLSHNKSSGRFTALPRQSSPKSLRPS